MAPSRLKIRRALRCTGRRRLRRAGLRSIGRRWPMGRPRPFSAPRSRAARRSQRIGQAVCRRATAPGSIRGEADQDRPALGLSRDDRPLRSRSARRAYSTRPTQIERQIAHLSLQGLAAGGRTHGGYRVLADGGGGCCILWRMSAALIQLAAAAGPMPARRGAHQ